MNRQITLAARPEGFPKNSDFALVESEIPKPGPGEVLVHSQWLSLDPYMRGRMSEARSYAKPTQLGEPMTGQAVGEVVEPLAWRMIRSGTSAPIDQGAEMRQAFMSIEQGFTTYSEGMTRVAERAQPWGPGACRRR